MKNFYLTFSIIIFLYQIVYTQVISKTLFGVSHKDVNNWVAVGQEGTITGVQTSLSDSWFQGISFADANNGIAVGWHGVVFSTTNGGQTWTPQSSGTNHLFYEVSAADANTATAVGTFGTVRRTTNGGQTWTPQSSATQNHLYGVSFTDVNNGTVVGELGTIRRTFNGGANWVAQSSGTTAWLYGVSFTDSSNGTAVGWNGTIIRTTNAGATWITQNSGTMQWLNGVHFINSNIGTAVGCGGTILRTTDGGQNWVHQVSGTNSILFSVSFADINNGVAVGESGTILETTDGGANWLFLSGSSQVQSHNFIHDGINRNYFVFLPKNYSDGGNFPIVINLHGATHYSQEYMYLTNMNPVADTVGFIAVYPNSVAGDWNRTNNPSLPDDIGFIEELIDTLSATYNVDLERVYISGFSAGGSMSHLLACQLPHKIAAIAPLAGGIQASCNTQSAVPLVYQHGTHDFNVPYGQGLTALNFWIQLNEATAFIDSVDLPDIDPNDGSTVTKFTYRRSSGETRVVFYRINNGGHQWSGSPLTIPNNSIKNMDINTSAEIWNFVKEFTHPDIPVELESFSAVTIGNNITLTWVTATELNNHGFELFRNGNKIAFVEGKGTTTEKQEYFYEDKNLKDGIYNYRLEQLDFDGTRSISSEVTVHLTIPEIFSLEQNYPNPFNPSTTISWQSPVAGHQVLKVFDVLGNEVATLVDEFNPSGRYEVEFDGSDLVSGVYFYRLKSGEFAETKKLLLLK